MAKQLLTIKEAASILSVSKNTMYNLIHAGRIPYFRIGVGRGTIRIERSDVEGLKMPATIMAGLKHLG